MHIYKRLIVLISLGLLLIMTFIVYALWDHKMMINDLLLLVLIISVAFLLIYSVYLYWNVSAPLKELLKGTKEIGWGNLNYQIQVKGTGDFALLAKRFNEMAQRLKQSYAAELEQKLLDRTREFAALDAVTLTLSHAGNLTDLLDKSLLRIFDSLAGLEPRGGIFLRELDGETLRLAAQYGLSSEHLTCGETVRMGECLCGKAAQTGEVLYTEHGCEEPLNTRYRCGAPHSHIIIPIKSRDIVLGVFFLFANKDFRLKQSDLQMLEMIGAQLGLAIENFRFYEEVKEASEKYWDLFENAHDILFTVDPEGRLTSMNKEAEKFSGFSKVELIGKSVLDFLTRESAQTAVRIIASFTQPQSIEFEAVKRDGSRAFIEANARKLFNNHVHVGYQVSARDITEQKSLRKKLVTAERLGAIGQVGIAMRHEINNPLTTVIGNVELLLERYDGKDKHVSAQLEIILSNALRIAEIIKRVQELKQDKVVEYLKGVKMTDLIKE